MLITSKRTERSSNEHLYSGDLNENQTAVKSSQEWKCDFMEKWKCNFLFHFKTKLILWSI